MQLKREGLARGSRAQKRGGMGTVRTSASVAAKGPLSWLLTRSHAAEERGEEEVRVRKS